MKSEPLNRVIGFALSALPDSIKERKALLADLLALLPAKHPLRRRVCETIEFLAAHERHQLNLSLDFRATPTATAP